MSEPVWLPIGTAMAAAVTVYAQDTDPGTVPIGSLWIETDQTAMYGPQWIKLTQAQYNALAPPDPNILYIIVG